MRNLEANHEAMQIYLKSINLSNFKSHQDLSVNFGECTEILGDNGEGKSTISELITWTLYGTDMVGSKLDPTPITYEADETRGSLLLNVNGKDLLLGRELKKGKTKYIINEVPSKAGDFNEILDQMFDKDLFLSLFNPSYFFTLHWQKQREMVLQYITAPANKAVFKEMPEKQSEKLAELVKKHSLADVEKINREAKTKLEKQYIAAQSRTKTLKGQLEDFGQLVALSSLRTELNMLIKERNAIEQSIEPAQETNAQMNSLNNHIFYLNTQRDSMKEEWARLKSEVIQDTCRTCKQTLQDDSIKAVEADLEARKIKFKADYDSVVSKRKEMEVQLAEMEYVDVSAQLEKAAELQEKIKPIEQEIRKHSEYESMQELVQQAEQAEKDTLRELNESIFIIDSIKAFYAKEAELQTEKVQALFENLSIKLFETQKNDEIKPTFEIEMDGKGYSKLSTAESIRAGLELRDVLSEQSGVIAPCFIDNAESITKFKDPNGQLIIGRVVAGQELKIEQVQEAAE